MSFAKVDASRITAFLALLLTISTVWIWSGGSKAQLQSTLTLTLIAVPLALAFTVSRRAETAILWLIHLASFLLFLLLRTIADEIAPVYVVYPVLFDQLLGLGTLPTLRLQDWLYTRGSIKWWDQLCLLMYASHFLNMWIVSAVLTVFRSAAFAPFMLSNALMYFLSVGVHFLVPTAPPWMAGALGYTRPVARLTFDVTRGFSPDMYQSAIGISSNDVAAMPSVHIAVAWLVVLACRHLGKWSYRVALAYAMVMLWSVVYGGEHYVVDAIAGIAIGWLSWRVCWWYANERGTTT